VPHRAALLLALVTCLTPAALRVAVRPAASGEGCVPMGRGLPPRGWIGCAADGSDARALTAEERLALGLPIDPSTAGAEALTLVPGLSRRLADELVRDRAARGPFASPDDLLRVRGVGPRRLARARPWLQFPAVEP